MYICTCGEGCHHCMNIDTLTYYPGGQNCWTARSLVLWFTVHRQGRLHYLAETEQESKLCVKFQLCLMYTRT